jgi:formate dehydrogenase major subunit
MHPVDLARVGVQPGEPVTLSTRRGSVVLYARADDQAQPGMVFVAFCWAEAAVNELTHPGLDPVAKIPGFKVCAAKATAGGVVQHNRQAG